MRDIYEFFEWLDENLCAIDGGKFYTFSATSDDLEEFTTISEIYDYYIKNFVS